MYKELNDYELIYMVKESDDIFDILYQKYRPLINKYAYKYSHIFDKMGYSVDDLIQIGNMVLYRTMNYYSMSSDNMYYTYLNKAIVNAYNLLYRRCDTLKYKTLNNYISYDNIVPNTNYSYLEILGKDDTINDCSTFINFKNTLPFDEACILELRYLGYSIKEISSLLDIREYLVKKTISNIRKQLVYI